MHVVFLAHYLSFPQHIKFLYITGAVGSPELSPSLLTEDGLTFDVCLTCLGDVSNEFQRPVKLR